jgi:hypothetical protein
VKSHLKLFGGIGAAWGVMAVVAVIANLALLAGAVWVIVWVLRETGVIQ